MDADAHVVAVHRSATHAFTKSTQDAIVLLQGLGVDGDAHCGRTVQNRYQMRHDRLRPNLRQVHLIAIELLDNLRASGFDVGAGDLGENISTRGLDMTSLPYATRLHIGASAIVEVTGLREPCVQIERFCRGLQAQITQRRADGGKVVKSGLMGIVIRGGVVRNGDRIALQTPDAPHVALEVV